MASGPKIQMPSALSAMFDMTTGPNGELVAMTLRTDWASFLSSLQQIAFNDSRFGTTGNRPTSTTAGRFEGMKYFDTTLGFPVFLKTASSNVWVDGGGVVR